MKEELLIQLKEAMKEKDELKKNTITLLRAAILQVEKDKKISLSDEEIKVIVSKEVKKRKESLKEYEKVGRLDIIDDLRTEIDILSKYLPEQLTNEEVENLVKAAIIKVGATSIREMGKVMKELKPKIQGNTDGKLVSDLVKQQLS